MKVVRNCARSRKRDVLPSPDDAIRDRHPHFPRFAWNEHELIRLAPVVCGLHALGPRPLYEFLRERVGLDHMLAIDVEQLLQRYSRLDAEIVAALNGRDLQMPLALVNGDLR